MDMVMTTKEIVKSYLEAKDQKKQIQILAELNAVPRKEIVQILYTHGAISERSFGQYNRHPPKAEPKTVVVPESADNVNHPKHYTAGGIECIDALASATAGLEGIEAVCTANAIKYLWRWKRKNGTEDLRKAVWYINRLIKEQSYATAGHSDRNEPENEEVEE